MRTMFFFYRTDFFLFPLFFSNFSLLRWCVRIFLFFSIFFLFLFSIGAEWYCHHYHRCLGSIVIISTSHEHLFSSSLLRFSSPTLLFLSKAIFCVEFLPFYASSIFGGRISVGFMGLVIRARWTGFHDLVGGLPNQFIDVFFCGYTSISIHV